MQRAAIIGGGASGLAAAIECGRGGVQAVIFEANEHVGKPILATGNGRCNLSNTDIYADDYNRPAFVQQAMNALPPEDVQLAFADAGLLCISDDAGRIFPYSNKAATVVDILRLCAREAGVEERCGVRVSSVEPDGDGWRVVLEDGTSERFDAVVVAVGGRPPRHLLPEDIEMKKCRPMLTALTTETELIRGLSGIRVRARVYTDEDAEDLSEAWMDVVDPKRDEGAHVHEEYGEVLFRDYGISGIAVFDMSRYVHPGQMVFLDVLPDMEPQEKVDFIYQQALAHPTRTAAEIMGGLMPSRVARAIVKAAGLNPDDVIMAEQEATVLAMVSESFGLKVTGVADPKKSQVTRGGYAVKQFDPRTMECKAHPGLYVTGEALDIDGRCGGYNLHWAWTSGMLAGRAIADAAAVCPDVVDDSADGAKA
jgi:predicted Rossmann fold flavoprotein